MQNDTEKGSVSLGRHERTVLHVGCGLYSPAKLHHFFRNDGWREVRVDLEEKVLPDIVASIEDLSCVADKSVQAVWSSHNLEHLHDFQVSRALRAFRRVLDSEGFVLITTPDIEQVARMVIEVGLDQAVYVSPAGPVTPLDMMFGHQPAIRAGHALMAHKTAFTAERLARHLSEAGFRQTVVQRGKSFDLWAIGFVGDGHIAPELLAHAVGDVWSP